jgi:hypothetical protein
VIGTEKLELMIELVLWSGCLRNERPLSLLIIARPESGKSELVLKYKENRPGVVVLTDCTAWGIQRHFLDAMKSKLIHHIIIPDLLTPLSRTPSTVATFIAFFNNLIEEGIVEVHTYATDFKVDGLNVGLISTITPSVLRDARHRWARIGFLSRMLPVAYKYSQKTAQEILQSITRRDYYQEQPKKLSLPSEKQEVDLPKQFAEEMLPFTKEFTGRLDRAERLYGFRYQKQLQVLLASHALMSGRSQVTAQDVEVIKSIVALFGTEEHQI